MSNKYNNDNNYKREYSFSRVKFGIDNPILETELNEMQKIQEDARASIVRQMVPSGFLEKVTLDFKGQPIIFNPNNQSNKIAIAPCRAIVDGYEILVQGNSTIGIVQGYEVVDLGEAPTSYSPTTSNNYDLVFLEVWFQEIGENSNIYKNGNVNGKNLIIPTALSPILDSRVGAETARRVGLRYRVRVQKNIVLKNLRNVFSDNDIVAQGSLVVVPTEPKFSGVSNTGDNGLFVAKSDTINEKLKVLNGAVYAIPMFAVKRRVFKDYDTADIDVLFNAPKKPTAANKVSYRPDGLFCDYIVSDDVVDLRNIVSFSSSNPNQIFDEAFKKIITGSLQTKSLKKLAKKDIIFDGISNAFDNRPHIEEVVQVVDGVRGLSSFEFDPTSNSQVVVYDAFTLSVDEIDGTSAKINFDVLKVLDGYTLSIQQSNGSSWINRTEPVSESLGYVVVDELDDYTQYRFRLKAKKGLREFYSNYVSFYTLDTTAPSPPTNLIATNLHGNGVTLKWSASTDNNQVTLYRIYNVSMGGVETLRGNSFYTSYIVSGLTLSTEYKFTVKAIDAAGNESDASNILTITTQSSADTTPPSKPTGLTAPSKTATSVTLTWNKSTDNVGVTKYKIYNAGIPKQEISENDSPSTTISCEVTGLNPSTPYSFTIKAKDAQNNLSDESDALSITTLPDTEKPTRPTNFKPTTQEEDSISFSWTASTDNVGVARYEIYSEVDTNPMTYAVTVTTHEVSGLQSGKFYPFSIRSFDTSGNGSNPTGFEILVPTKPIAPTNINVHYLTKNDCEIYWNPPTGETDKMSYRVYRRVSTTYHEFLGDNKIEFKPRGADNAAKLKNLSPNTTYEVVVKAVLFDSSYSAYSAESDYSSVIRFTTPSSNTPPTTPTNLQVVSRTTTSATLSWDSDSSVKEYDVYINGIKKTTVTTSSYVLSGLVSSTSYIFEVLARDNANLESSKASINFTTLPSTPTLQNVQIVTGGFLDFYVQDPQFNLVTYKIYKTTYNGSTLVSSNVLISSNRTMVYSPGNFRIPFDGTSGMTYYFRVSAVNSAGLESARSNSKPNSGITY